MLRPIRAVALFVAASAALSFAVRSAVADQLQNAAVSGDAASLNASGFGNFGMFGPLNGELVTVGVIEAGGGLANSSAPGLLNTSPNSTLPNGNPDLPSTSVRLFQFAGNTLPAGGVNPAGGPVANPYPAGLAPDNHSSEVTGVIVGQGRTAAADTGIAIGSTVQEAGITGAFDSPNGRMANIQQSINNGASLVNLSLGAAIAVNNGQSQSTQSVDWAAQRFNTVITIAGNEDRTEVDTPADSFNGIVVAATGVRVNGKLSYDQEASYNVSSNNAANPNLNANRTADGRIGVSLVAPGGDPGTPPAIPAMGAGNTGTFLNPPNFVDQFTSTAGGQYDLAGTNNANAVYSNDAFAGVTSAQSFVAINDTPPKLAAPFPAHNPGPLLGGGDSVTTGIVNLDGGGAAYNGTLAGTSYAAPLVAGAGAVVSQYGLLATATNAKSSIGNFPFSRNGTDPLDHRVLKAILLNGASKSNTDGTQLLRASGTPWTRSTVLQGAKALPAPLAANAVGPVSTQAQSGLDPQLGAGQLNLVGSLTNYAAGEQGPGAPARPTSCQRAGTTKTCQPTQRRTRCIPTTSPTGARRGARFRRAWPGMKSSTSRTRRRATCFSRREVPIRPRPSPASQ